MDSGFVRLRSFYDLMSAHPTIAGVTPGTRERRLYRLEAARLCAALPKQKGFYLWGRFEKNGLWRNLYLGKAGFGRTSDLRVRVTEELQDEAACLWIHVLTNDALKAAGESAFQRYQKHHDRSIRKAGSTHIIWVADPTLSSALVSDIESDLIETMTPRANVSRPVPPASPQEHTHAVIRCFRQQIHQARKDRFFVPDHFLQRVAANEVVSC